MRFWLKQMVLAKTPEIEIGLVEFEAYRVARKVFVDAFALEEKWDIAVTNYQELETELMRTATEHAVREVRGYQDMFMLNAPLTVRIVNLLTAARLYLDQAPRHLSSIAGMTLSDAFKAGTKKHYDECFEYRFMEALRNYVQHSGTPVHMVSHGGSWRQHPDGVRRLEYATVLTAKKENFLEDAKFKAAVLAEMPDELDLMIFARKYVECLSHLQGFVREKLLASVEGARLLVEQAVRRYAELPEASTVGLQAISTDEDGHPVEKLPVFLDWDNVRVSLEQRNPVLVNLSRRYVTSKSFK